MKIVRRQTTFWEIETPEGLVRVTFKGKAEARFLTSTIDAYSVATTHPTLVDYTEPWGSIYVVPSYAEARTFAAAFHELVLGMLGTWRTCQQYLNPHAPVADILRTGGMILCAPESIVEGCEEILLDLKVDYSVLGAVSMPRPTGSREIPLRPLTETHTGLFKVFLAGPNFVVARDFGLGSPNKFGSPQK